MGQSGEAISMLQRKRSSICFLGFSPEANYPVSRSIDPFDENKCNKKIDGSWRKEFSAVYYEL